LNREAPSGVMSASAGARAGSCAAATAANEREGTGAAVSGVENPLRKLEQARRASIVDVSEQRELCN
jgi:hypothetical protein